jgi:hypothetical protein
VKLSLFRRIGPPWLRSQQERFGDSSHGLAPGSGPKTKLTFDEIAPEKRTKLIDHARQEVWRRLFPAAKRVYDEGGIVEYGQFGVAKDGLARGGEILPWDQIDCITVDPDGKFTIRRRGTLFRWYSNNINAIPNFFVLQALVEMHISITKLVRQ